MRAHDTIPRLTPQPCNGETGSGPLSQGTWPPPGAPPAKPLKTQRKKNPIQRRPAPEAIRALRLPHGTPQRLRREQISAQRFGVRLRRRRIAALNGGTRPAVPRRPQARLPAWPAATRLRHRSAGLRRGMRVAAKQSGDPPAADSTSASAANRISAQRLGVRLRRRRLFPNIGDRRFLPLLPLFPQRQGRPLSPKSRADPERPFVVPASAGP